MSRFLWFTVYTHCYTNGQCACIRRKYRDPL